eukprot:1027064-Pleurochrysis_carterae.AAC.1
MGASVVSGLRVEVGSEDDSELQGSDDQQDLDEGAVRERAALLGQLGGGDADGVDEGRALVGAMQQGLTSEETASVAESDAPPSLDIDAIEGHAHDDDDDYEHDHEDETLRSDHASTKASKDVSRTASRNVSIDASKVASRNASSSASSRAFEAKLPVNDVPSDPHGS